MSKGLIISGTDTGIGKTTVAAMLTLALGAVYWKPVQSGLDGPTDRESVRAAARLAEADTLPEAYVLRAPLSPHRAAELDGLEIDPDRIPLPRSPRPLIVEGAGGLLVPINRRLLQIDLFAVWGLPVVLCARTALGTINHTLLSIEALRRRGLALQGLIFIGDDNPDTIATIAAFGEARVLGRVPILSVIDREGLAAVFAEHFRLEDFL